MNYHWRYNNYLTVTHLCITVQVSPFNSSFKPCKGSWEVALSIISNIEKLSNWKEETQHYKTSGSFCHSKTYDICLNFSPWISYHFFNKLIMNWFFHKQPASCNAVFSFVEIHCSHTLIRKETLIFICTLFSLPSVLLS